MDRVIFHCDLNCFYASVELLSHPELREVPVAVAGDPASRHGIILAKTNLPSSAGSKPPRPSGRPRRNAPIWYCFPPITSCIGNIPIRSTPFMTNIPI